MGIIFGSARIDENGNAAGGAAGDQTGNEVSTQSYYMHSKGWYCLRPKSATHAANIAAAMQQACNNNNIGYDQNQRGTCFTQLKKYGTLAKIATKCETDCSALVRCCVYQGTGKDVGDMYTGNLAAVLEKSGLFESRFSVSGESQLYNGDVLVTKSKGHTVIVVSGRARSGGSSARTDTSASTTWKATGTATSTADNVNVRTGAGTNYTSIGHVGTGNRFEIDGSVVNGWYHVKVAGIGIGYISGQYVKLDGAASTSSGSASTGSTKTESAAHFDKSLAGKYKVTASDGLNLRAGAGTSKKLIATMPRGATCQNYGYYSMNGYTKWLYVVYKKQAGFASADYLKKA